MVTRIRLHGGPGDGLLLGVDLPGSRPPEAILYHPDTITIQVADPTRPVPGGAAYYTRLEHLRGRPWDYRFQEQAARHAT